MFNLVQFLLVEEKCFCFFIRNKEWLQGMPTLHNNVLRKTYINNDLAESAGNDADVLEFLMKSFKPRFSNKCDDLLKEIFSERENILSSNRCYKCSCAWFKPS